MGYISGEDRHQIQFYTNTLEELLDEDNPVRIIDAFVESLNMGELKIQHAEPASTGRPPYHPKDLLKLYIYGYFNHIRSSRRLMTECGRNIELFYLLNRLVPDFRTIADFRKNNAKAVKQVFKAFVKVCMDLNLYERELIAIDGSKFRAVNGRKKMYNEEILKKKLVRIEEHIAKYLNGLDQADQDDQGTSHYTSEEIKQKLAELGQRKDICRQCPHRCTPSKNYKVVKFGSNTKYVPILMYGTALKSLQKYPASEIPYNAFKLLKGRAKKNVVVHIKDDIPTQKLRLCLSEHPFGTVKWYHGAHYLLCKGIEKATAELGLSFLAYNLKRAINMVGIKKLVAAMKA
ncbi:MAG: transposase [Thermincola sp.]|jgi:transposase|nr:transposase [Thermincola sp.]MDT3703299.1 transposase [Thermincola sp.]